MASSRSIEAGGSSGIDWTRADRAVGDAPAVRSRQIRKAWGRYKNPLDIDLEGTILDLVAATSHPRAEIALDQTRRFIRKHGGVVALRPDHGTIANPTKYKDPEARAKKQRLLAASTSAIDVFNDSFGEGYAREEDEGNVEEADPIDPYTLCNEGSLRAAGEAAVTEDELVDKVRRGSRAVEVSLEAQREAEEAETEAAELGDYMATRLDHQEDHQ